MARDATRDRAADWMTPPEAARVLGVSARTVRRWARDNWLSYRRVSPDRRRIQVCRREVVELVREGLVPAFDAEGRDDLAGCVG